MGPIQADHLGMVKFEGERDRDFTQVYKKVKLIMNTLRKPVEYRMVDLEAVRQSRLSYPSREPHRQGQFAPCDQDEGYLITAGANWRQKQS
jgi:hypothetical protein